MIVVMRETLKMEKDMGLEFFKKKLIKNLKMLNSKMENLLNGYPKKIKKINV